MHTLYIMITSNSYFAAVETPWRDASDTLRKTILENLPSGFVEIIAYNMPAYVVPQAIYPPGYHCDPKQPLPFISMAVRKSGISFYHMGLYAMPETMDWFAAEFFNSTGKKPDIGKSCIRFKKPEQIPFEIIAQLVSKISVQEWINVYESTIRK